MTTAFRLAAIASFILAGTASAETFTSVSKVDGVTQARAPAMGGFPALGAGANKGEITATFQSGRVEHDALHCIGWNAMGQPQTAVCEGENGPDKWSARVTCTVPDPTSRTSLCSGQLIGTAGRYAGKTGVFSQVNKPDGTAAGQGAWND